MSNLEKRFCNQDILFKVKTFYKKERKQLKSGAVCSQDIKWHFQAITAHYVNNET